MLNPQHTVHITINEKLCVKSVLMVSGSALPRDVDMNPSAGTPHSGGSPCQSGLLIAQQHWHLP